MPKGKKRIKVHELKCWPEYWNSIRDGFKTFEIRKDDRGFRVGDELVLRQYYPDEKLYSGNVLHKRITYITNYAQRKGYVVMSIVDNHLWRQP